MYFFIIFDCMIDNLFLFYRFIWLWFFFIGFIMVCVFFLIVVCFNYFFYEVLDYLGDEGDDDLDKVYNKL